MNSHQIRPKTVKLISRLIQPWTDEGIVSVPEQQAIIANLKSLAATGELAPAIVPKLIDQRTAAEMLGLGLSNFKKLEKESAFPFKRRMVGSSVRYRNVDIVKFILLDAD